MLFCKSSVFAFTLLFAFSSFAKAEKDPPRSWAKTAADYVFSAVNTKTVLATAAALALGARWKHGKKPYAPVPRRTLPRGAPFNMRGRPPQRGARLPPDAILKQVADCLSATDQRALALTAAAVHRTIRYERVQRRSLGDIEVLPQQVTIPAEERHRGVALAGSLALTTNFENGSASVIDLTRLDAPAQATWTGEGASTPVVIGSLVFVSNLDGSSVSVIDLTRLGVRLPSIKVGERPLSAVRAGQWVLVACAGDSSVWVIDLSNLEAPARQIAVGPQPLSPVVAGEVALVACQGDSSVCVIDLNSLTTRRIAVGRRPGHSIVVRHLALTPIHADSMVSAINLNRLDARVQSVAVGHHPVRLVAVGNWVLVVCQSNSSVWLIDLNRLGARARPIWVFMLPEAITVANDLALVTCMVDRKVAVIDLSRLGTAARIVDLGLRPRSVAVVGNLAFFAGLAVNGAGSQVVAMDLRDLSTRVVFDTQESIFALVPAEQMILIVCPTGVSFLNVARRLPPPAPGASQEIERAQ